MSESAVVQARPARSDKDEVASCRSFGYVRGRDKRATMLTLKSLKGNECSVEWAWTPDVVYTPGAPVPVTLVYSSRGFKVEIVGENLDELFDYLQQRRVVWIRQQDRLQYAAQTPPSDASADFVEDIRIAPLTDGEDLAMLQQSLQTSRVIPIRPRERMEGRTQGS